MYLCRVDFSKLNANCLVLKRCTPTFCENCSVYFRVLIGQIGTVDKIIWLVVWNGLIFHQTGWWSLEIQGNIPIFPGDFGISRLLETRSSSPRLRCVARRRISWYWACRLVKVLTCFNSMIRSLYNIYIYLPLVNYNVAKPTKIIVLQCFTKL